MVGTRQQENQLALAAAQVAVATDDPDLVALTERIRELRAPGRRGARPVWVRETLRWSDRELAAATLWHVARGRLSVRLDEDGSEAEAAEDRELPPLSSVGTDLGEDLLARYDSEAKDFVPDPDAVARKQPMKIGGQLLEIAASVGAVVIVLTASRGGHKSYRVTLAPRPFERLQRLVNGISTHVYNLVTTTPPVTGVAVRKPHKMLEPRASLPLRAVMAAERIQGTPWRINRAVLERLLVTELQNALGTDETDSTELSAGQRKRRALVIAEAQKLAPLERFFWGGFLEFRGRFFQQSGALSYTNGDDYARGLLEFAEGERLDLQSNDLAFGWLAYHAAQMWGDKTEPYGKGVPSGKGVPWLAKMLGGEEVDLDHVDVSWVRRAAEKCVERWREAKKPAQFLAAALALVDACDGRPVHLPVRVDATCSGVQHLTLLLRDERAAKLVRLWGPAKLEDVELIERPPTPDFYDAVTSASGVPGLTRAEAKAVIVPLLYGAGVRETLVRKKGKLTRKKSTLAQKLAEERRGEGARATEKDERDAKAIVKAAKKLARKEFELLRWFGKVAKAHNGAGAPRVRRVRRVFDGAEVWEEREVPEGVPVRWRAPDGFEVVQDYRYVETDPERLRRSDRRVDLTYRDAEGKRHRVNLVKRVYTDQLDKRKAEGSVKANVVHSLDAALLVEIVAGSSIDRWGVAHDAFAVPPGRVEDLLQANRDAIRALYTSDRLAEWTTEWRKRVEVPDPPEHPTELPRQMWSDRRTLS